MFTVEPEDEYNFDPDSCIAYIALQVLASRQESLFPELLYILSPVKIIELVKTFSGESVKFPTIEDFRRDLSTGLAAYHIIIQGKSWDWYSAKYGYTGAYLRAVKSRTEDWFNSLTDTEKRFIERLRKQEESRIENKVVSKKLIRRLIREPKR